MKTQIDEKEIRKRLLEGHFYYEVINMRECISEVFRKNPDRSKVFIENYFAVAFFTHARNLWEFFYAKDSNPKKFPRVNHYILEWDITPSVEISKWYGMINKYLSHLTYGRINDNGFPPIDYIYVTYEHFRELILEFLEKVSGDYKGPNLTSLLINMKNEVKS